MQGSNRVPQLHLVAHALATEEPVLTETVSVVWKDNLRVYAEALGKQEALALRLGEYRAKLVWEDVGFARPES